jgi:4a-hydroxytetrahydrobiopterin dehydratase
MSLSRNAAAAAVDHLGWRLLNGSFAASFSVDSLREALKVAAAALDACGPGADDRVRVDLRPHRVEIVLQSPETAGVDDRAAELAALITEALAAAGRAPATPAGLGRPVQQLEIAIDALDIPTVRPFWKAVLDYDDAPDGLALRDPARQLPSIWFQQMDEPRRQRNRIHFDLDVAHDDADRRVQAALAAGGVLVSDADARAFWVLADPEGNEICICTWQDRD